MKIKYKPWEQVVDVFWNKHYVNTISIWTNLVQYECWDWETYKMFEEWQLEHQPKSIWFKVEYEN